MQRQKQNSRILIAKYNKRYKELDVIDVLQIFKEGKYKERRTRGRSESFI